MKICPKCNQTYIDESLNYCLIDGTVLNPTAENKTAEMNYNAVPTALDQPVRHTDYTPNQTEQKTVVRQNTQNAPKKSNGLLWVLLILGGVVFICGGGLFGLYAFVKYKNDVTTNSNNDPGFGNKQQERNSNVKNVKTDPTDSKAITMEKFKQIEMKIGYKKAVEILGSEGDQMSSSGSGDYKTEMYKWSDSPTEFVILMFMNDKLTNKTQSGLGDKTFENLSLEQYNKLKNGMKLSEVTAILGEGDILSQTEILGSNVVSYQWKGDEFKSVTVSFQNDKVISRSQFGLK